MFLFSSGVRSIFAECLTQYFSSVRSWPIICSNASMSFFPARIHGRGDGCNALVGNLVIVIEWGLLVMEIEFHERILLLNKFRHFLKFALIRIIIFHSAMK